MLVTVEAGAGVWWNYKLVKTAEAAEPSVLAGTWYMSLGDGSLGVGPSEFDISWWSNSAEVTETRACYFDDEYVFGAYGSFANVQQDFKLGWKPGRVLTLMRVLLLSPLMTALPMLDLHTTLKRKR